ncbi:hypothetical protein FOL47_011188, partial [Perkinsus chesapeaki]
MPPSRSPSGSSNPSRSWADPDDEEEDASNFDECCDRMLETIKAYDFGDALTNSVTSLLSSMKSFYIGLLEENRALRVKADRMPPSTMGPYGNLGRSYKNTLLSGIPLPSNSSRPNSKNVLLSVKKTGTLPATETSMESSLEKIKTKVCEHLMTAQLPVNKVFIRNSDVAVLVADKDSERVSTALKTTSRGGGYAVRTQEKLLPEVLVRKEGLTPEDIMNQCSKVMNNLSVESWKVVTNKELFVVFRMPTEDRDTLIRNDGVYVNCQKLRCHDFISINYCYDCGGLHGKNGTCSIKKKCLFCAADHKLADCPFKATKKVGDMHCSLCDADGHCVINGPPCIKKLEAMRARLDRIDYTRDGPAFSGPLSKYICLWVIYADDAYLLLSWKKHQEPEVMRSTIEKIYRIIRNACEKADLHLERSKCKMLTNDMKLNSLGMTGMVSQLKVLGMCITARLNFFPHIKERALLAQQIMHGTARYVKKSIGLTPYRCLEIFDKVFVPRLCYGIEIYGSALASSYVRDYLDRIGNAFMRMAFKLRRSTPVNYIYSLSGRPPLSQILISKAIIAHYHKGSLLNYVGRRAKGKKSRWETLLSDNGFGTSYDGDILSRYPFEDKEFTDRICIPDSKEESLTNEASTMTGWKVYTDGSMERGPGKEVISFGAAFYACGPDNFCSSRGSRVHATASIMQAELYGIIMFLNWAVTSGNIHN